MWMTPFYLFFGVLFIYVLKSQINLKKISSFLYGFLFLFFLSPSIYLYESINQTEKRTDYPGKEIALKTQAIWNQDFDKESFYGQFGSGSTFPQVVVDATNLGGCSETIQYLKEKKLV